MSLSNRSRQGRTGGDPISRDGVSSAGKSSRSDSPASSGRLAATETITTGRPIVERVQVDDEAAKFMRDFR